MTLAFWDGSELLCAAPQWVGQAKLQALQFAVDMKLFGSRCRLEAAAAHGWKWFDPGRQQMCTYVRGAHAMILSILLTIRNRMNPCSRNTRSAKESTRIYDKVQLRVWHSHKPLPARCSTSGGHIKSANCQAMRSGSYVLCQMFCPAIRRLDVEPCGAHSFRISSLFCNWKGKREVHWRQHPARASSAQAAPSWTLYRIEYKSGKKWKQYKLEVVASS